jgi:hypothetical protein
MKRRTKLEAREQSQENEQNIAGQTQQQSAREFATTEELLQYDASQTPVPPAVGQRLQESLGSAAPPQKPFWRRLFGE